MSGFANRYRTLGELRHELRIRLGFAAQGTAAESNRDVLNAFLQEALDYVYEVLDVAALYKQARRETSPGASLYDWYNAQEDEPIDPQRVQSIWVTTNETSRTQLIQGVDESQRALSQRGRPNRYDTLNGQLELWPMPDARYTLLIHYLAPKARLTQDHDRPNLPDRLILLYALATAKAHYRHPDAAVAGKAFEALLATYRSRQHEHQRYFASPTPRRPAQVAQTTDGYQLL